MGYGCLRIILYAHARIAKIDHTHQISASVKHKLDKMSANDIDADCTCNPSGFTTQTGPAQETRIDLSSDSSVNEEDIDPFTYHPPFTKWDYLKVQAHYIIDTHHFRENKYDYICM